MNRKAKQELFKDSPLGKAVGFSDKAIKKSKEFLNKPSTKRTIKNISKALSGSNKKRRKKTKTHSKKKRKYKKSPYSLWRGLINGWD